jgi:uncharacterized Zn finger protein (UPF0148 family)
MNREFICEKCGYTIISLGYDNGKDICALCQWLEEFVPDKNEQKEILHHVREGESDEQRSHRDAPRRYE